MGEAVATDDFVRRFLFEDLDIRGGLVRLGPAWRTMVRGRAYPGVVARLMGEMTAVSVLIASSLKQPGRITVQLRGHGAVRLLVIDVSAALGIRGTAHHAPEIAPGPLPDLLGDGRLVLTLQSEQAAQPYQSLVPLVGESIAAVFEHFLAQSEQQPARLWLAADEACAAGLFLQKLPEADARDPDGWNRIEQLAATMRRDELTQLPVTTLLTRVFPDETLRLFKPSPVFHDCPEDWDKVRRLLRSLGRQEIEAILEEHGEVRVHDDMCNRDYRFSAADVAALFAGSDDAPTLH